MHPTNTERPPPRLNEDSKEPQRRGGTGECRHSTKRALSLSDAWPNPGQRRGLIRAGRARRMQGKRCERARRSLAYARWAWSRTAETQTAVGQRAKRDDGYRNESLAPCGVRTRWPNA